MTPREELDAHYREVGASIKKVRKSKGVGQLELATRMGWEHSLLDRYERGVTGQTAYGIEQICCALDVEPSEIHESYAHIRDTD